MEKKFAFMGMSASYDTGSSASLLDAVKSVTSAFEEALVREIPRAEEEDIVQMFDAYAHDKAPWYGVGLVMVNAALLGVDVLLYVQDENCNRFEFTDIAHVEKVKERWGHDVVRVTGMQFTLKYKNGDKDILFLSPSHLKAPALLMATCYRNGREAFTAFGEDRNVLAHAMAGCVALDLMDKEEDS